MRSLTRICIGAVFEDEKAAVQSVESQRIEEVHRHLRLVPFPILTRRPSRCASFGSTSRAWCVSCHYCRATSLTIPPRQLTNLGALPLSRIHSTLNMLAPGYKGKTTDELTALLEQVMAEGLVQKTASGSWKIVK